MKQLKGLPRPLPAKPKLYPYLSFTNRDNLNNSGLIPHASRVSMPLSRGCMRQLDSSLIQGRMSSLAAPYLGILVSSRVVTHLSNNHIPLPSPYPVGFSRARAESQPHANILYRAILC
ncbi:hypothetical protein VNO77_03056 [Canavalia gladiata]|uniref:Uncharacterized protein n=1 Tax=Canavalia gladiata TaxID=3824 RepID=A0AAN9MW41_CANGL